VRKATAATAVALHLNRRRTVHIGRLLTHAVPGSRTLPRSARKQGAPRSAAEVRAGPRRWREVT
jgi:hypothetical protein